jgi:hypothetical protein
MAGKLHEFFTTREQGSLEPTDAGRQSTFIRWVLSCPVKNLF